MSASITCPHCRVAFNPGEVMRQEVESATRRRVEEERTKLQQLEAATGLREAELLRRTRDLETRTRAVALEVEQKVEELRGSLRTQIEKEAEQRHALRTQSQLASIRTELAEARAAQQAIAAREAALESRARILTEQESNATLRLEQQLHQRTEEARKTIEAAAEARHTARAATELAAMSAQLATAKEHATRAATKEVEIARRLEQVEERERKAAAELEATLAIDRKRIRDTAEREAEQRHQSRAAEQLAAITAELAETRKRAADATQREVETARLKATLDARAAELEMTLERRLVEERQLARQTAEAEATARIELATRVEREDAAARLQEASARADSLAKTELEARRHARDLEERLKLADLDTERQIAEQARLATQRQEAATTERIRLLQEQHALTLEEHRQKTAQLERTALELQRRITQGSQQLQGEAQEVLLRDLLTRAFVHDTIEDVGVGMAGADLLQHVRDAIGTDAGTVIWESKRTQKWSDAWLPKLRDNLREAGAVVGVIVSQALPDGIVHFGQRDGVWVCSWSAALAVAAVLRSGLLDVAAARRIAVGASEKQNLLFEYMTGPQFRNRITGIVEAFTEMQEDLRQERRALQRIWSKRDKQLDLALKNVGSMYGDLQGIVGKQIEGIQPLELDAGDDDLDLDEDHDAVEPGTPEPALVATVTSHLLRLLPTDGGGLGHVTLRDRVGQLIMIDLDSGSGRRAYEQSVLNLIEEGKVRRGRGRGGSLARVDSDERAALTAFATRDDSVDGGW